MPTTEEVQAVIQTAPDRYKRDGAWLSVPEIANLLCTGEPIPNPTPQGHIVRAIPLDAALAAMSDASLTKLINTPLMSDFIDACKASDMPSAKRLMTLGVRTGQIQPAEAAALAALDGLIPDPAWQSTIIGPPPIQSTDHEQVAAAIFAIDNPPDPNPHLPGDETP